MKDNAVTMNYVVAGLVILSLCYQIFQSAPVQFGSLVSQIFILASPLITVLALKYPSNLSRRTALSANILIIILVVFAAVLGLGAGSNLGAVIAMAVLFIPFIVNVFVLMKSRLPSGTPRA